MFDLGWSEMAIVLLVALLVLGPKELPKLARDLGRWVGKARSLSREFQRSLEDMARETELEDVKKQLEEANREFSRPQLNKRLEKAVDPTGELKSAFDPEIDGGTATSGDEEPVKPPTSDKPAAVPTAVDADTATPSAPAPSSAER